jgi:hypothetical protein
VTGTGDFMTVITSADRALMRDSTRLFETMMAYAASTVSRTTRSL